MWLFESFLLLFFFGGVARGESVGMACVVVSGSQFEFILFFLACTATHVWARTS